MSLRDTEVISKFMLRPFVGIWRLVNTAILTYALLIPWAVSWLWPGSEGLALELLEHVDEIPILLMLSFVYNFRIPFAIAWALLPFLVVAILLYAGLNTLRSVLLFMKIGDQRLWLTTLPLAGAITTSVVIWCLSFITPKAEQISFAVGFYAACIGLTSSVLSELMDFSVINLQRS